MDVADDDSAAAVNYNYKNLSTEELSEKINVFVKLSMGNKINPSNAFDIDIIEYFSTWLKKKKPHEW